MKIIPFSKFIIRTPVFPFSFIQTILESQSDCWVFDLQNDKIFMHGLLIASPVLFIEFLKYDSLKDENKKDKIKQSILKYAIRSSTRCTPFGLFSGIGILSLEDKKGTKEGFINIVEKFQYSRLDYKYVTTIIDQINSSPSIRENLIFYVNSTLYSFSNNYRYVDYSKMDNSKRKYELIQVKKNKYLNVILKKCKSGYLFTNILKLLTNEGFDESESRDYINNLIDSKILISEIEPTTIGDLIENKVLNVLTKIKSVSTPNNDLDFFLTYFEQIKENINSVNVKNITESFEDTQKLIFNQNIKLQKDNSNVLYKDLYVNVEHQITENQERLISKGLQIFNLITSINKVNSKTRLDIFKDLFSSKYESESIPLILALDIETGIGYDDTLRSSGIDMNFLIENFPYNNNSNVQNIEWQEFDKFIIRKIEKSNIELSNKIEITQNDLNHFKQNTENKFTNTLSSSGILRFSLFKNNLKEDVIYIDSLSTSSPNKILGRFSHGNHKIHELVKEITEYENDCYDNDTIIAEIDHLPYAGFGNTLFRADFNRYTISYHGGANSKKNINIDDLYITHKNNEIILTSKKLKKRIIPYFSNAFNDEFPNILPVFKFLFDLHYQHEDRQDGYLSVAKYHNFFKHIPRLYHKNIILSKESWFVSEKDFFSETNQDENYDIDFFNQNCYKLKLPRYFSIVEGDLELLIDIESQKSIRIFLSELKKKKKLHLREFLLSDLQSIATDKKNSLLQYNNEFFYPFKNNSIKRNFSIATSSSDPIQRNFYPGSKWISLKIYLGSITGDKLLIRLEKELQQLLKKKFIKKYYFLKYGDPNYHIRLRLLLTDVGHFQVTMQLLNETFNKFIKDNLVKSIVIDTYKRELERYGAEKIVLFENIFFIDTKLVISLIKHLDKTKNLDHKWLYSLKIINIYLEAFGFSLKSKIDFSNLMKKNLANEFNSNKVTTKFINEKYLYYKKNIDNLKNISNDILLDKSFKKFSNEIKKEAKEFKSISEPMKINFLSSIIHMHIIRLVGANNNRLYELIIYTFYSKELANTFYKEN